MAVPLLLCLGAAKAGTSWLYRALHDHPECRLPAVKELHYWDSFEAEQRAKLAATLRARLAENEAGQAAAESVGLRWQVENKARQVRHLRALLGVIEGPRKSDALYRRYLEEIAQGRLTADITPAYGLLSSQRLDRLLAALPGACFVYLVRDPLARLWSHVRMQAERQKRPDEELADKANGILRRIVEKGHETHIVARGDYAGAMARLGPALPQERFRIEPIETLSTPSVWGAFCAWLGLAPSTPDATRRVHPGPKVAMDPRLEAPALAFLKDQYDWAARSLGDLPDAWRPNMERALA